MISPFYRNMSKNQYLSNVLSCDDPVAGVNAAVDNPQSYTAMKTWITITLTLSSNRRAVRVPCVYECIEQRA